MSRGRCFGPCLAGTEPQGGVDYNADPCRWESLHAVRGGLLMTSPREDDPIAINPATGARILMDSLAPMLDRQFLELYVPAKGGDHTRGIYALTPRGRRAWLENAPAEMEGSCERCGVVKLLSAREWHGRLVLLCANCGSSAAPKE